MNNRKPFPTLSAVPIIGARPKIKPVATISQEEQPDGTFAIRMTLHQPVPPKVIAMWLLQFAQDAVLGIPDGGKVEAEPAAEAETTPSDRS